MKRHANTQTDRQPSCNEKRNDEQQIKMKKSEVNKPRCVYGMANTCIVMAFTLAHE